jgi:hypothetical protein
LFDYTQHVAVEEQASLRCACFVIIYIRAEDWTPKKLEVEVPMPEELHIEQLRSNGQQPGEQLQPEDPAAAADGGAAAAAPAAAPEPDPAIVMQLVTMGFSENGSKRAGRANKNKGCNSIVFYLCCACCFIASCSVADRDFGGFCRCW